MFPVSCTSSLHSYANSTNLQISTRQATRIDKTIPAAAPLKTPRTGAIEEKHQGTDKPLTLTAPLKEGTFAELIRVIKTSGWASLFAGLSASLVGTTISQGVYFYLYSLLRQAAVRRRRGPNVSDARSAEVTVAESLLVATLAGMGNVLMTSPIWVVATRMQAYQKHKSVVSGNETTISTGNVAAGGQKDIEAQASAHSPGAIAVARDVFREYGIGGFWNGVGASLAMVINPTIQYALYEWLTAARSRIKVAKGGKPALRPSALEIFVLSAVAKAGATIVTYPLMTVKTRMMTARKTDTDMQYTSILDAVVQISKREGVGGYYKGIRTKILQSVLAAALLFMCKEKITDATRELLGTARKNQSVIVAKK